jgi:hypothetical protein
MRLLPSYNSRMKRRDCTHSAFPTCGLQTGPYESAFMAYTTKVSEVRQLLQFTQYFSSVHLSVCSSCMSAKLALARIDDLPPRRVARDLKLGKMSYRAPHSCAESWCPKAQASAHPSSISHFHAELQQIRGTRFMFGASRRRHREVHDSMSQLARCFQMPLLRVLQTNMHSTYPICSVFGVFQPPGPCCTYVDHPKYGRPKIFHPLSRLLTAAFPSA